VESNTAKMLSQKLPLRQAYDFIDERMGGSMSMEIMLDTGKTDGVKEPAFLRKMDALQDFADNHPLVTKTMSVLDVLKKMRRAMHNNDQEFYSVPDRLEAASQYLFMYETSGGDQLDKLVGFDYDIARLTVKTRSLNTADVRCFMRDVEDFSRKTFDGSVSVGRGQIQLYRSSVCGGRVDDDLSEIGKAWFDQHDSQRVSRAHNLGAHGFCRDLPGHAPHVLQRHYYRCGRGRYHTFFQALSPGIQGLGRLYTGPAGNAQHGGTSDYLHHHDPDPWIRGHDPIRHIGLAQFRLFVGLCLSLGVLGGFFPLPSLDTAV
jgi:hypothetical protein